MTFRLAIPALLVLLSIVSVCLSASPGPEILPGTPITILAPGGRFDPAIATNGTDELVVWVDQRGGMSSIVATRMRNGVALDPLGILIHEGFDETLPEAVNLGDSWLIVWNSNRGNTVWAARLSRDGQLLAAPKVLASQAFTSRHHLAVIGSRAVTLFWRPGEVHALVLDAGASVVAHHTFSAGHAATYNPSVTASARQFLVLWDEFGFGDPSRLKAVRLSPAGDPLDGAGRMIGVGQRASVASDGNTFAVVAYESDFGRWQTFRLDASLRTSAVRDLPANTGAPFTVVWTGSRYVALGLRDDQLSAVFLDETGTSSMLIPWTDARPGESDLAALATRGELFLGSIRAVGTNDRVAVRTDRLNAQTLTRITPERLVSFSANEHAAPDAAFDGTNHLVVWREVDGIFATRVTSSGASLDGRGIELAGPSPFRHEPRVVYDGRLYIVAWLDRANDRIALRFIDAARGGVVGEGSIAPEDRPVALLAMAAGTNATLIVWSDTFAQPIAARIDRASQSISAPVALKLPGAAVGRASAAWNGSHFLVAWEELVVGPRFSMFASRIRGVRLTESLEAADQASIVLADTLMLADSVPALASNGKDWLLVWFVDHAGSEDAYRAVVITADGAPAGHPEGVYLPVNDTTLFARPAAAWDGSRYVVALTSQEQIELRWLTPTLGFAGGSRIDTQSSTVSLTPIAAVYTRRILEIPYAGVNRSVLRTVSPFPRRRAVR